MPCDGALHAARYVPGRLFSVNAATAAPSTGLFARNERVVCVFDEGAPAFALVLVGALFVGSMSTAGTARSRPRRARRPRELHVSTGAARQLAKGEEIGRFNMGSTVILLLPRGSATWLADFSVGSRVQVGQPLARRAAATP